ncbi:MAG: TonB-dependent receptor [Melioribacteraceae bacterium]|nr:TonB-dependent receptor [Melioribacteraceae bacterium]
MKKKITSVLLFLLMPAILFAGTVGKIRGTVTDGEGNPLISANILVVGTSFGAATDVNGEFLITNLEAGIYEVKASYVGFQSVTISNIRVNADLTTALSFELPEEGYSTDEIMVIATQPLVNKSSTNANRITTGEDIEALPVRGMDDIVSLTPGVVLQDNTVFIRGGRKDEVGYYLEGASISDPVAGGRGVTIPQDAIEEIQVQAGGYNAEYGGANAGIIYTQMKSGPSKWGVTTEYITDNITFKGQDDHFGSDKQLGAYWYGYDEFTTTLGGPIFKNNIRFFGTFNYSYQRDKNPQAYPGMNLGIISDPTTQDSIDFTYPAGILYKNSLRGYSGTATLSLDFNPFIFKIIGTYTSSTTFNPFSTSRVAGNIANMLNLARVEKQDAENGALNLKFTHLLNATTFYELNVGYSFNNQEQYDPYLKDDFLNYGDSLANAKVGWDQFSDRYEQPTRLNIFNWSFHAPGTVSAGYYKYNREKLNISGALSTEFGKEHSIKIGGELQLFKIRNYGLNNENAIGIAGILEADRNGSNLGVEEILRRQGVNNYGYDVLGNEFDGDGYEAPKTPVFAAFYIQDKIEYKDLVLNLGLRYDYIDIDNQQMTDATRPEFSINYNNGNIIDEGWEDVPAFGAVSPRLGFSFAVTDETKFHAQYGKFVQQTRLRDAYTGLNSTSRNLRGGLFILAPVGYNVRPTRTTQYEMGFTQQISDFASFDITGFYKDIQDQIVFKQQRTNVESQFAAYTILENGDFATTKGLEISFNMRRTQRFLVNASLSFQDAQGTGSYPNSNAGLVGAPLDGVTIFEPQYISPLEYNRSLSGNISVDYRFGENEGSSFFNEFGISTLLTFNSGHPFTLGIGGDDLEGNPRDRQPIEALGSSTTPSNFQVNLRIDKTFSLFDKVKANVYVYVINLFDKRNIENVFLRTGSSVDDGYLSDPDLGGLLAETNGADYVALYNAINHDYNEQWQNAMTGGNIQVQPRMYGPPRQIRLGVKLEY